MIFQRFSWLLLVFLVPALSQTLIDRANELQQVTVNSGPFLDEWARKYVDFLTALIWDDEFKSIRPRLPSRRPLVVVKPEVADSDANEEFESPHAKLDSIDFPVSYLGHLMLISEVLGHDIAVKEGPLSIQRNPLLAEPFSSEPLLPLLMPLDRSSFTFGSLEATQQFLIGTDADPRCKEQLGISWMALTIFVLTHEMSHIRYGHRVSRKGEHPVGDEILADQNAFMILQELRNTLIPDAKSPLRKAFTFAPIVWLTIEAGLTRGAGQDEMTARRDALLKFISQEDRDEVTEMLEPDRSDLKLGRLRTTWSQLPEHLFLDGLAVDPSDLHDKQLLVASGEHIAIGTIVGKLCYASAIVEGDGDETLSLRCVELRDGEVSELERLEKAREWFELLVLTSNDELAPKRPDLAYFHGEALHRLKCGRLIPTSDWTIFSTSQQRRLRLWQHMGLPLGSWY